MKNQTEKQNSTTEQKQLTALLLAATIDRVMANDPSQKAKLISELVTGLK